MVEEDFDEDELAMLRQLFRDEAHELLEGVTARALSAGAVAPSSDALSEMMRVTHTLKGAAGTVGLDAVVDLSHRLESALADLRGGAAMWSAFVSDQLVEIVDGIRAVVDASATQGTSLPEVVSLRQQIAELTRRRPDSMAPPMGDPRTMHVPETTVAEPWSDGVPALPTDSDSGARTVATLNLNVPAVVDGKASDSAPMSLERGGLLRVEAARIDELMSAAGELLFDRTRIERRVQFLRTLAKDVEHSRQTLREALTELAPTSPGVANLAAAEADLANQAAQLSQTSAALLDEVEALRRTIGDLQRGLTRVRMQTARSVFLHLARAARAVSRAVGARVELRTSGEDTEFDKTVAEQIVDPLIQLLRNAIVHGIESPTERVLRGKTSAGVIWLRARQDGNLLVIELSDDGRGMDPTQLRDRLVTTGRWTAARAQIASDDDVLHALFEPGVSSRDDADEFSGRGIGLDLVRETIARLGGEVRLASKQGRGTTFTLRLPLSTAVTQAMLFKVAGQVYALPGVHVTGSILIDADATDYRRGDDVLPLLHLAGLLGATSTTTENARRPGLIIEYAGKSLAVTVDKLIGAREIVVKPLGPLLAPLALYAGATISASGKVQLILDTAQIVRRAFPDAQVSADDPLRVDGPRGLAGRVLVVDDSRAIREAMTTMLARDGWIVDVAEDGAQAFAMAKQVRYDLVVTDLEMPEVSGWDLIDKLRSVPRLATTGVVIITSRATTENIARAKTLGVVAMVAKPITRHKLLYALSQR